MVPGKGVLVTGKTFVDSGPSLRRLSCYIYRKAIKNNIKYKKLAWNAMKNFEAVSEKSVGWM